MTGARLAVIGESLIDVIVEPSGTRTVRPGGSPMNVAIGAARLGIESKLITAIGNDAYGALLREHIVREGVALVNRGRPEHPSNEAVATLIADGSATYAFHLRNDVEGPAGALAQSDVTHLHVGSLTAMTDTEWQGVLAAVEAVRGAATISYDPNCRSDIGVSPDQGRARVEAFIAESDIVKASDEDLAWLYPDETIDAVIARWIIAGPKLVVVTRGAAGPIGYTAGGRAAVLPPSISVVDTVGAGDSFMAAMLAWCDESEMLGPDARSEISEAQVRELLSFSACAAALTCTRMGANPPTRAELDEARLS